MKQLIIVTREEGNEYEETWGLTKKTYTILHLLTDFCVTLYNGKDLVSDNSTKNFFDRHHIEKGAGLLNEQVTGNEVGILIHKETGKRLAKNLFAGLSSDVQGKTTFCKNYTSQDKNFWDTENSIYLKFIKAWRSNDNDDKTETFNAVWKYFEGDRELRALLEPLDSFNPQKDYTTEELKSYSNQAVKLNEFVGKKLGL